MPSPTSLFQSALLVAAFAAACTSGSPTTTERSTGEASFAKGGQSGGCVFVTPSNGKAHTASENSAKCTSAAELAGPFEATRLILHEGGETFDLLAHDEVVFELTLNPDGTTSGRFFVPQSVDEEGNVEEGSGIDVDLGGTFTVTGNQLTFDHVEDTPFEQLTFTVRGKQLSAKGTVYPVDPFGLDVVLTPM